MSLFSQLLAIVFVAMLLAALLFVIFGQITVRKLRKNTLTTNELGTELASGLDIINVAQALAVPLVFMRKLKNSPLSGLYADPDLLRQYTSTFDKVLAAAFYWLLLFSGLSGAFLLLLNALGVFD